MPVPATKQVNIKTYNMKTTLKNTFAAIILAAFTLTICPAVQAQSKMSADTSKMAKDKMKKDAKMKKDKMKMDEKMKKDKMKMKKDSTKSKM